MTQNIADIIQDAMIEAVGQFVESGGLIVTSITTDGATIVVEGFGPGKGVFIDVGSLDVGVIDDYQPPTVTPVCTRCGDAVHVRGSRADCNTCMVAFAVGDDGTLYPRFSWR